MIRSTRPLRLAAFTFAFVCGFSSLHAQSAKAVAASTRVTAQVDPSKTTVLRDHVPEWAIPSNDLGAVDPSRRLDNMHLVLNRAPAVEAAFQQLLVDQQNPSSPYYHQWLTPEQNAAQYGIAPADLAAVTNWLQSWGLSVDNVAAGGVFITFSGTVANVQNAFSTQLHSYSHESAARYAPISDPMIPSALAGVIGYVSGLSENVFTVHSHVKPGGPSMGSAAAGSIFTPQYTSTSGAYHYVTPGDFNTIYDIATPISAGTSGTGYTVGILIDSDVVASDITGYKALFGITAAAPNTVVIPTSSDPGVSSDEGEADLDVQRVMGTAPGASIHLVVFQQLSDTLIQSALQYEISNLNDSAINMSFGSCDYGVSGLTRDNTFNNYFSTASAQGISIFSSSGDNAAAGCDDESSTIPATQVLSTNIICAGPYVTCVGGTEFNDTASPTTYWNTSNTVNLASAIGYIPEGAWNEPGTSSPYSALGTGGGVSQLSKPSWQTGTGVPNDGVRDLPDISFTASGHDAYLVCEADVSNVCTSTTSYSFKYVTLGTSASSPSMAGISTLIDQKLGARQGNLNPTLYKLATSTPSAFHDATPTSSGIGSACALTTPSMCNNSTPTQTTLTGGLAGYALTTGYDQATGLGSLDVAKFLTAAATTTVSTTLAVTAASNPISAGQTDTFTATLTRSSTTPGAATGTVQFYNNGVAFGSAVTISNNVAVSTAQAFPTAGTYSITAVYSGDTNYATSTSPGFSLTVNSAPSFSVVPTTTTYNLISGATTGNTDAITLSSLNSFAGGVTLTCTVTNASGTAAGTCGVLPGSVTLASGGTGSATLTINTTPGTSGALSVTVTGTSGTTVVTSSTITVALTASSFTLAASPTTLSLAGNATTNNTTSVTITSVNGFAGTVTVGCASSVTTIASCTGGSAVVAANGTAKVTVTVTPVIHTSGAATLTLTGTGTTAGASIAVTATASVPLTVTTVATTTTVVAAPTTVVAGSPTTLTATVVPSSANGNPTGSVSFTVNGASAGTATISTTSSPYTASVTYTPTAASSVTVVATYAGDSGYAGSTSTTTGGLTVSGFTAAAATPSLSFTSGATTGNTDVVTFTSVNGYAGTVNVTCSISSGSAAFPPTCSANPISVTLTSGGAQISTISIGSTTAQAKTTALQAGLGAWGMRGGVALAALLCLIPFRRRRNFRSLATFALLAAGLAAISGCGGGGNAPSVPKSSAGSYTVTVTGTSTNTPAVVTTTTFALTIN